MHGIEDLVWEIYATLIPRDWSWRRKCVRNVSRLRSSEMYVSSLYWDRILKILRLASLEAYLRHQKYLCLAQKVFGDLWCSCSQQTWKISYSLLSFWKTPIFRRFAQVWLSLTCCFEKSIFWVLENELFSFAKKKLLEHKSAKKIWVWKKTSMLYK